jgi:hypothetical protein
LRFKVIQALLNFFFTFVEVVSARGRGWSILLLRGDQIKIWVLGQL